MQRLIQKAGILCICAVALACSPGISLASDAKIIEMRNRIFEEAKGIQFDLGSSPDTAVLLSLWDSTMITITQLNAYFYMLGIFEDRGGKDAGAAAFDYLKSWLQEIKRFAQENARNYASISAGAMTDARTKAHVDKVKRYLSELITLVDAELKKVALVQQAASMKRTK